MGVGSKWEPMDELGAEDKAHICISVGFLLKNGKDIKVVVPHFSPANANFDMIEKGSGDMAIPTCSIVKIITLIEDK